MNPTGRMAMSKFITKKLRFLPSSWTWFCYRKGVMMVTETHEIKELTTKLSIHGPVYAIINYTIDGKICTGKALVMIRGVLTDTEIKFPEWDEKLEEVNFPKVYEKRDDERQNHATDS